MAPPPLLTVLHVGCGPERQQSLPAPLNGPGWREIRLDIDPAMAPDIVASITHMPTVATASVNAVWSSHNLEHLEAHEVPLALAEFRRVLLPTGVLGLRLPDLQTVAQLVAADRLEEPAYQSPAGPITPLDMLYGLRNALAVGNRFMAHRTGFTARSLDAALRRAGFARVEVTRRDFDLWANAWPV